MPDWSRIIKGVADTVEVAAALAQEAKRKAGRSPARPVNRRRSPQPQRTKVCHFWECDERIRADHTFCYDHYTELREGEIDDCPGCGRGKYAQYDVCMDCYRSGTRRKTAPRSASKRYEPEHSPAWEKGDEAATRFFVYILKLDGGKFYAGQTRELRERLSEHSDGRVQSTAGTNPRLVWFATLPTRNDAATMEVELKKLVDSNPREVRRIVIGFRDLVRELDYS